MISWKRRKLSRVVRPGALTVHLLLRPGAVAVGRRAAAGFAAGIEGVASVAGGGDRWFVDAEVLDASALATSSGARIWFCSPLCRGG